MQGGMLSVMSRYKPSKIKAYLDTRVIGQDEAKETLAVAGYNHMKRSVRRSTDKDTSIRKSNVILLGATGCRKTLGTIYLLSKTGQNRSRRRNPAA